LLMLIIAERINASRRYIASAIVSENKAFIQNEAKAQALAGADYIDVNAGIFEREEAERLKWVIEVVQAVTDVPLSIDSPDPKVIKAVLASVNERPIINSITLEPKRLEGILPLAARHKTKVIGLCQSGNTTAETVGDKVRLAGQLVERVTAVGISLDDLYIDPLVYPLAANPQSAVATIRAIEQIMTEFPGVRTTLWFDQRLLRASEPKTHQSNFSRCSHFPRFGLGYFGPNGHTIVRRPESGTDGVRKR
jgi:5-methyltetrahydrofolate corrinoid/iron sulfur protein methyltransferase